MKIETLLKPLSKGEYIGRIQQRLNVTPAGDKQELQMLRELLKEAQALK